MTVSSEARLGHSTVQRTLCRCIEQHCSPAQQVVVAVGEGPARLHKRQLLVALKVPDGLEQPVRRHLQQHSSSSRSSSGGA